MLFQNASQNGETWVVDVKFCYAGSLVMMAFAGLDELRVEDEFSVSCFS